MKVEVVGKINLDDLIIKLRKVPLLKPDAQGNPIHVYKKADISLRELHPNEVNPTTFYLIRKNLDFQKQLRNYLLSEYNIDSLKLDCALELKNEKGELWTLTPPIIELTPRRVKYHPAEGDIAYKESYLVHIPIINDGAHRIFIAREEGIKFKGLVCSDVADSHPFYAHPNEWDKVKIFDEVPKTKEGMKLYRKKDNYSLYRDFGIIGCGKPRGIKN